MDRGGWPPLTEQTEENGQGAGYEKKDSQQHRPPRTMCAYSDRLIPSSAKFIKDTG